MTLGVSVTRQFTKRRIPHNVLNASTSSKRRPSSRWRAAAASPSPPAWPVAAPTLLLGGNVDFLTDQRLRGNAAWIQWRRPRSTGGLALELPIVKEASKEAQE